MIKASNIKKTFKGHEGAVLDGVSLELNNAEILGVIGVNGSGKSTLISILAGVMPPSEGSVEVDEERLCYVPQKMVFFDHLSVRANLELFASGIYKDKKIISDKISELRESLSLEEVMDKKVKDISEGNKRKLNIAISLLRDGDIFLLDEPIVNIDYNSRRKIEQLLLGFKDEGKIVVLVSHHRTFLETVCTKVLYLENGKQKYYGDLNEEILSKF